jgi:hypothetical protein
MLNLHLQATPDVPAPFNPFAPDEPLETNSCISELPDVPFTNS